MSPLVPIMLFGWVPFVLHLFRNYPARQAVMAAFILAWCFLPNYSYDFPGIPDLNKTNAASYGILLGCYLYDREAFARLKLHWIDIPMLVLCSSAFFASLTNGLGAYDGFSETLGATARYGLPYLVGRIYFTRFDGLRDLAEALFLAGVLYAPFCLFESKMSPQLHQMFYGFRTFGFTQVVRLGGFRPVVFMEHGLMTGMWMSSALLCGVWLVRQRAIAATYRDVSVNVWLGLLAVATLLCRSSGAMILFAGGTGLLWSAIQLRLKVLLPILLLVPLLYVGTRATGAWTGQNLVAQFAKLSAERAQSLDFRFINEDILVEKALLKPLFGWGGWGRSRVYDEEGKDVSVTDGLWIILLGTKGFAGLFGFVGAMLLPGFVFFFRAWRLNWGEPRLVPAAILSTLVGLSMVDNLLNAMYNPFYVLIAGGLAGCVCEFRASMDDAEGGTVSVSALSRPRETLRRF